MNWIPLYLLAFAGGFAGTAAALPLWRPLCSRLGLIDEPGGRKTHEASMPLAGGLAIATGLLAPAGIAIVCLWMRAPWLPLDSGTLDSLIYGLGRRRFQLAAIFAGALGMLAVGILDDRHELRPALKFAGQVVVALLVAMTGVRVTLFVPSDLFSYAVTVLWIVTVINAFNFTDNMNGLCAGLGVIGAFYFAAISGASEHYLVAALASLVCGAIAGFIPSNYPNARVFLGDSGSHLVGYLLAVLAILPHFHTPDAPRAWAVLSPLLILAVPLGDLVRVVLLRWRMGKPFYIGDQNHLSHRLVQAGMSRAGAVALLWLVALVLGAVPLLL
ncbi:MAG TPA: undecaprenyl/decaprenyl-phosphate alpha-N-acetylglucosaminyl 1-phosphate transferase [Verrucomicrobia bacterium]|nr:undecaprenyl/decaprenyl-phosphate alpha-N-acetylglucosaminyl 1-phosphate transferase [Verrucomicrobiota bacterium]HOB32670.1 MraY family glycosyltransferase [Verrucomicrobiota bacterium]HOP96088.1 MraY family glycosyltransferase [Verrucomicrobiota bacterium]